MNAVTAVVVFTKAVAVPLGVGITLLAYRAYRRTDEAALRSFAVGFGAVTAGAAIGGGFELVVGVPVEVGLVVQGVLTAVGFGLLARSLYVREVGFAAAGARERRSDR